MKTTLFFCRCILPLGGAALLLAAGCSTSQPAAGIAASAPRAGPSDTPVPDNTGPHPTYIINDSGGQPAGVTVGLIVNLQAPTPPTGDDSGLTDSYEVPTPRPGEPYNTGPHPAIIAINLPPRPSPPEAGVRASAGTLPRRAVVVIMGGANTGMHQAGRRTIVVHLPLVIPYNEITPPTVTPAPVTTSTTSSRHRPGGS